MTNEQAVSVVCACMNRQHVLQHTIRSWLSCEQIKEIVVVDWSSTPEIDLDTTDQRIKLIRVNGKRHFHLGQAYNFAIKHATCEEILKLDVDYMFNPYSCYFDANTLVPGEFITGDHRIGTMRDEHGFMRYLNGLTHMYKKDFLNAGGYNKRFIGYGHDDDDLYTRMENNNLERKFIDNQKCCVFHIPHSDNERVDNYQRKNINFTSRRNFYISKARNYTRRVIDDIQCIVLEQNINTRWSRFAKLNKGIKMFAAIDSRGDKRFIYKQHGLQLHPGSLQQQLYFSESPGAVGCFLSHYNTWKNIISNQTPVTLVLEEDARPSHVNQLIAHYDYISSVNDLARYDLVQFNNRTNMLNFPGDFNGTESYLLTCAGAEKLLASVHERPWFNNNVVNNPAKKLAHFKMFQNEPPQQWNQYEDCIVAAADTFIGLCGRLPDWCEYKLNIKHVPCVGLVRRDSTIFDPVMTPLRAPFWEASKEWELTSLMNSDNFKWWEHD